MYTYDTMIVAAAPASHYLDGFNGRLWHQASGGCWVQII